MAKTYKNINALKDEINKRMANAMNLIANEVYDELKMIIEDEVYGNKLIGNSTSIGGYKRSYEFLNDAWAMNNAKIISKNVVTKIFYYPKGMNGPDLNNPYRHGNFDYGIDRREQLAGIINYGGNTGDYDLRKFEARPFWDIFLKWLNTNWESLVLNNFKKAGLDIYTINIRKNKQNFELGDIF